MIGKFKSFLIYLYRDYHSYKFSGYLDDNVKYTWTYTWFAYNIQLQPVKLIIKLI